MLAELHNTEGKANGTSGQTSVLFLYVTLSLHFQIAKRQTKDGLSSTAVWCNLPETES